jgi:Tfp pilus assembly protein PilN
VININLRPGTRRAAKGGSPFAGLGDKFKGMGAGLGDPLGMAVAALWAIVILGLGFLWVSTSSKLSALEPQIEEARSEHSRYQAFMDQKAQAAQARDSILGQIGTISAVDRERFIWPHILDEVGGSVPDGTWITEVSSVAAPPALDDPNAAAPLPSLRIVGRTGDLANYTAFLRRLEASPWLQNVLPIEAKTVIEGNRALTSFIIQATYSQADSSVVRTVPILESVVEN